MDPPGAIEGERESQGKPFYRGMLQGSGEPLPKFRWQEPEGEIELKRTALHAIHLEMGAKIAPFAGWEMPLWYSSVREEHQAVRETAGLFDVSHMGIYQADGPDAASFLDSVCGNDISYLKVGQSVYTHFLDSEAHVIDDLLVYRRAPEAYLMVVNASNDDKDWAYLNALREGTICVDKNRPWVRAFGRVVDLCNLRDLEEGKDMLVDILYKDLCLARFFYPCNAIMLPVNRSEN